MRLLRWIGRMRVSHRLNLSSLLYIDPRYTAVIISIRNKYSLINYLNSHVLFHIHFPGMTLISLNVGVRIITSFVLNLCRLIRQRSRNYWLLHTCTPMYILILSVLLGLCWKFRNLFPTLWLVILASSKSSPLVKVRACCILSGKKLVKQGINQCRGWGFCTFLSVP